MTQSQTSKLVEYEREDEIVTLTLNRPDKLNAFNDELMGALSDALHSSLDRNHKSERSHAR